MRASLSSSLVLAVLLASPWALAQSGEGHIPYSDEAPPPDRHRRVEEVANETNEELHAREQNYGRRDDPNLGLAVEGLAGLFLLDSSKGAFAEPQFGFGARFTWELGRAFPGEALRDNLIADVTWLRARQHDGTMEVATTTTYDLFAVAPAWAFPFNEAKTLALFVQVGGGVCRQNSLLSVQGTNTELTGLKPLIQYGVGLRGTPVLSPSAPLRLSFRVELTRFRRGYLDDTFIGGSAGFDF